MRTIVLDTNCLLASLPSVSPYHKIWTDLLDGRICLCVSNDILEEYEEIIAAKTTSEIAKSVVKLILQIQESDSVRSSGDLWGRFITFEAALLYQGKSYGEQKQ